jgi:hypothetical protein
MIPSVKTTHARPAPPPRVRISIEAAILICPHCMHVIGSFKDKKERAMIESRHTCEEKRLSHAPLAAVPYS